LPVQIASWQDFKELTEFCRVKLYRLDETATGYRVRVAAGRYLYEKEYSFDDPELKDVTSWCGQNAYRAVRSVPEEVLFA